MKVYVLEKDAEGVVAVFETFEQVRPYIDGVIMLNQYDGEGWVVSSTEIGSGIMEDIGFHYLFPEFVKGSVVIWGEDTGVIIGRSDHVATVDLVGAKRKRNLSFPNLRLVGEDEVCVCHHEFRLHPEGGVCTEIGEVPGTKCTCLKFKREVIK